MDDLPSSVVMGFLISSAFQEEERVCFANDSSIVEAFAGRRVRPSTGRAVSPSRIQRRLGEIAIRHLAMHRRYRRAPFSRSEAEESRPGLLPSPPGLDGTAGPCEDHVNPYRMIS